MQRSALCRSRRELSNQYLLAKIGVDTAEKAPLKVWRKIQFIVHSPPYPGLQQVRQLAVDVPEDAAGQRHRHEAVLLAQALHHSVAQGQRVRGGQQFVPGIYISNPDAVQKYEVQPRFNFILEV